MVKLSLPTLLQLINERHGTALTLGERYALGEQGAFAVTDATGERFVLKWGTGEDLLQRLEFAAVVADRLRSHGYPTPRYSYVGRVAGMSYALLTALPGAPMGHIREEFLPELLQLNDFQAGQARTKESDWPTPVVDTILIGGNGYCLLETLRTHSTATRELLARLQSIVTTVVRRDDPFVVDDIVHFDFSPANILVADGQVSGVVDWEGACAGDRAFDLATLLFYGYEDSTVRETLRRRLLQQIGPGPLSVYLAHMMIRQVEWSIRYHDRTTVAHRLRITRAVLRDVRET